MSPYIIFNLVMSAGCLCRWNSTRRSQRDLYIYRALEVQTCGPTKFVPLLNHPMWKGIVSFHLQLPSSDWAPNLVRSWEMWCQDVLDSQREMHMITTSSLNSQPYFTSQIACLQKTSQLITFIPWYKITIFPSQNACWQFGNITRDTLYIELSEASRNLHTHY